MSSTLMLSEFIRPVFRYLQVDTALPSCHHISCSLLFLFSQRALSMAVLEALAPFGIIIGAFVVAGTAMRGIDRFFNNGKVGYGMYRIVLV